MTARCSDPRCTDGPPEHDEPRPRWAVDGERLCLRCGVLLERRLSELPACRDALAAVLGGTQGARNGGNSPTKGMPPIPLNIDAHDHLVLMHDVAVAWVQMVLNERNLRGPDRNDLRVLCGWLTSQLPWLLQHEAVGDLADEVRDLVRTAEALAQTREQWHRKHVPCPRCKAEELGTWDGEDSILCRACSVTYSQDDYLAEVARYAKDTNKLLDRAAAALLLGVTRGHLRVMISRREVTPTGTIEGRPYFAVADLEEVMTRRRKVAS